MPVNAISLQKLVYIANAMHLTETGQSLLIESPIVGEFDPEFPTLTQALEEFGLKNIHRKLRYHTLLSNKGITKFLPHISAPKLENCQIGILKTVCSYYSLSKYNCLKLTRYTGGTRENWTEITNSVGVGNEIPRVVIANNFYNAVMSAPYIQGTIERFQLASNIIEFPVSDFPQPIAKYI